MKESDRILLKIRNLIACQEMNRASADRENAMGGWLGPHDTYHDDLQREIDALFLDPALRSDEESVDAPKTDSEIVFSLLQECQQVIDLARSSHNMSLPSYPPIDAWMARGVDAKLNDLSMKLRQYMETRQNVARQYETGA